MKPVLLVARPAAGGLRAHLSALLAHLHRTKWELSLAGPESLLRSLPGDLPSYYSFPLEVSTRLNPADLSRAGRLAGEIRRLQEEAKTSPVVHAHGIRAAWIASIARSRNSFPLVVTLHNLPPAGPIAVLALRFISGQTDRIICVSQAVARRAAGEKAFVIPNGIDTAPFIATDRQKARQELGVADGVFVVAAAARLSREKGIDLLVDAAKGSPEMVFLVAGSGPEEARLRAGAPANVRFLGTIRDTPALFAASDAVVIPSRSEGQGIVALEAMAAGRPAVAADVGGLPEMVQHGVNGLLVPPANAGAIRQALSSLRANPERAKRLGSAGREYALRRGDVREMIAAIERVYEEVARA